MAQHMFESQSTTTTGAKPASSLTKFPEFGATAQLVLTAGSAVVQFRTWNNVNAKEVLKTFVLPVPAGTYPNDAKTGDLYDTLVIAAQYENFDWFVSSITGGGTLTLTVSGTGL